jgi:multidrug resistance protein
MSQPHASPAPSSGSKPNHTAHLLIFLTVFIDLVGFGIVIPILPLYAKHFGASAVDNGFLVAIYSLMQVIFAPLWGKLSDRIGRRPVLLISVCGTAIGFILMAVASPMQSLILLFVARALDGISGGNISTAQAYLADITPPEKRAKMMGIIGAAFGLGFIFGPALAAMTSWISPAAPFYLAGAMAAANAFFIYRRLPESLPPEKRTQPQQKASLREVVERGNPQLPGVMVVYCMAITAFSIMTTLYSLNTAEKLGLTTDADQKKAQFWNGMLLTLVGVVGAVIQGRYIGPLAQKFGEKRLALTGALVLAVFLFVLDFAGALWSLALVSVGIALGNALVTPTLNALASRGSDASMQGRTMGLMASAGSVGRVIGPVLSGPLAHWKLKPFWWAAAIIGMAFVFILQLKPHDSAAAAANSPAPPAPPDTDKDPAADI